MQVVLFEHPFLFFMKASKSAMKLDSPNFSLSTVVGGILFPFSKLRNFYHLINKSVRKAKNYLGISRQSPNTIIRPNPV